MLYKTRRKLSVPTNNKTQVKNILVETKNDELLLCLNIDEVYLQQVSLLKISKKSNHRRQKKREESRTKTAIISYNNPEMVSTAK